MEDFLKWNHVAGLVCQLLLFCWLFTIFTLSPSEVMKRIYILVFGTDEWRKMYEKFKDTQN